MACDTLCRAPWSKTHGKDEIFVVRQGKKTHGKEPSLPCVGEQNARQRALFAVRRGAKRTAINGTFVVRPYKRTTMALFLLLVLVTIAFFVFHV
jgi:hypothetical protein